MMLHTLPDQSLLHNSFYLNKDLSTCKIRSQQEAFDCYCVCFLQHMALFMIAAPSDLKCYDVGSLTEERKKSHARQLYIHTYCIVMTSALLCRVYGTDVAGSIKVYALFCYGGLVACITWTHHDINPRSNDFYGPFVWETRQRLSTMGTSSEGKFVGDCSLFALFLLCHKRFHCFSLSLFFEKRGRLLLFSFISFLHSEWHKNNDPIVSSNIKRTFCACHMQGNARN